MLLNGYIKGNEIVGIPADHPGLNHPDRTVYTSPHPFVNPDYSLTPPSCFFFILRFWKGNA